LGYRPNHPTKKGCGALHAASTMKERTGGGCFSSPKQGATVFVVIGKVAFGQPVIVHESSWEDFCFFFCVSGGGGEITILQFSKMNSEKTLVVV